MEFLIGGVAIVVILYIAWGGLKEISRESKMH